MPPDPSQREQEIFAGALELAPAAPTAYLAAVCAGDAPLRDRVETLLRRHEADGGILDRTAAAGLLSAMSAGRRPRRHPVVLWGALGGALLLIVAAGAWLVRGRLL